MKQKVATLLVVVLITSLLSIVVINSNNKEKQATAQKLEELKNNQIVFYYSDTCSHCKDIEAWFAANQIEEKIQFAKKEVHNNKDNAAELRAMATSCGIDLSSVGVPFLYAENKCLVGAPEIIEYFGAKLGIAANQEASQAATQTEGNSSATGN